MDKELFNELQQSIREMKQIEAGELPPSRVRIMDTDNEMAVARKKLNLTQTQMAALLGTPVATYRGWEQGRRAAHKSARILVRIAARNPKIVFKAAEEVSA